MTYYDAFSWAMLQITPSADSRLDPDTDPAWRDAEPDEDRVTCDQCGASVLDKDAVGMRGGVLCADCYDASADEPDDNELDIQREDFS